MLKKILSFFMVLYLCACASNSIKSIGGQNELYTEINEISTDSQQEFRVGVLLPLTGEFSKQGNGLKNATMMALDDINDNSLLLQYYDTKGTPEGASVAIENAINQGAELIIGPMLSSSVQAVTKTAKKHNVPVIGFNSASDVLQNGIYTMGLLLDEQVDRVISYSAKKGRSRFALLLPDNNTGITVAKAAVKSASKNKVIITAIGFYKPGTTDFVDLLKQMTNYSERTTTLAHMKTQYKQQANLGDIQAARMLKKLEQMDSYGDIGFDTVLMPDYGTSLKSAVAMFGYYDVFSPDVKFIGTSIWENTALNKESTMFGSWYPSLTRQNNSYFFNKYTELFEERPSSLYAFGYDAVALASAIVRGGKEDLDSKITNPEGYLGINGAFRFFPNGLNQHSLDIKEVRASGNYIVDPGPRKFKDNGEQEVVESETFYKPSIYGKKQATAEMMIYGRTISADEYQVEEDDVVVY